MPYEYHKILYDTSNKKLARVLEAIRQRQKQDNPFIITVRWISGEFKPYSGYIVFTNPTSLTQWDSKVSMPLLAWNRKSSKGKHLDPSLIESITFASAAMRAKHLSGDFIYVRDNEYFDSFCNDLLSNAIF